MKLGDLKRWSAYWQQLQSAVLAPSVDQAALDAAVRQSQASLPVPVVWLLGKTQAGKTSIIHCLTGSPTAEIGNGFQPCTRSARLYDHPAEAPVVRFLDTRGLGERAYDPDEDIRYCEAQANLVVAVMKVADQRQEAVFEVLRTVRERHPEWPLVLVQTGLHELYPPNAGHLLPWPYADEPLPQRIPADLRRALQAQRSAFDALPGTGPSRAVAVDLTLPEDGFAPPDYGLAELWAAIEAVSTLGLQERLGTDEAVSDVYAHAAHQHIVGHALTAAGLGALPVVDVVSVSMVQAKLMHSLAALYGQRWDRRAITEFIALIGAGVATGWVARMLGRSVVKVIPVWGQTIGAVWGASASGASTYALGKAAVYFLARRRAGFAVDRAMLRGIYDEALARGVRLLRGRAGVVDDA